MRDAEAEFRPEVEGLQLKEVDEEIGADLYCPALIARGRKRLDVIQYTRLCGYSISDTRAFADGFCWPAAETIVRTVTAQWDAASLSAQRFPFE